VLIVKVEKIIVIVKVAILLVRNPPPHRPHTLYDN